MKNKVLLAIVAMLGLMALSDNELYSQSGWGSWVPQISPYNTFWNGRHMPTILPSSTNNDNNNTTGNASAPSSNVGCYQGYQDLDEELQKMLEELEAAGVDISVYFPRDPNEIRGTVGYDNPNSGDTLQWVSAEQSLPYTIYFENDPELATAAAQRVEVRHPFHSLGNLATFGIGAFGFGEHIFEVEGSPSSYQQRLDLTEAMGLYVDVIAGVDVVTNEAFWIFQSIDPATGLPPQGTEGFLPINDENHIGEGFVTFSIKPMTPACSTGDVITASAYIVFDVNEAISTNTWLNTIDAVPPTTQLTGNETGANELALHFSGSDDQGGCGIKQYKLYVSDNYASYQLYSTYPLGSEIEFTTEYNHCYRFYCLGEDNVGNVEEMKTEPDFEYGNYNLTVTAIANPTEGGTVSGMGTFPYNATVTLTASPNIGYEFVAWLNQGVQVSTNPTYSFTVTENCALVATFLASSITQTFPLTQGWNWWSTYVEQSGIDGLTLLEEGLGTNGLIIKSQSDGYTEYYDDYDLWYGSLESINNETYYMIKASAPCTVSLSGPKAIPSLHPITVDANGWTWISYPVSTDMDINEALSGLASIEGDIIKAQEGYAEFYDGYGWYGTLETLTPNIGLMYKSTSAYPQTFTYPEGGRTALRENPTSKNNHWVPDPSAYPYNMTVTAIVELDDVELRSDRYELAAFADGETRGSVKLHYIEPIDRYVAFLTIAGEEAIDLYFGLYDNETGETYLALDNSIGFEANTALGSLKKPYIVRFGNLTSLDELANSLYVYPNPVSVGERFSIWLPMSERIPVRIEIVDALGSVLSVNTSTKLPVNIAAPTTAGVYTMRIQVEGKGTYCRKLIVK